MKFIIIRSVVRIEAVGVVDSPGGDDIPDVIEHTAARVDHVDVDVTLNVPEEYEDVAHECLNAYNTGCIVGQSLSDGISYTSSKSLNVE